jgi:ribosome-associated toxin RatA of RatAB toxin-antitoxin module
MMERLILCLLLCCAMPAMAQLPPLDVSVRRDEVDNQKVFVVQASGAVMAPPAAVWKILTNYERMPEFVPDLQTTRVVSRHGNEVIVEQLGTARFLFVRRDIRLVVRVTEQPISVIDIALITGDMKQYNCRWELIPIPETGGTRIVYSGRLVPDFYVPGIVAASMVRSDIERMMTAVLARLDRPDQAG